MPEGDTIRTPFAGDGSRKPSFLSYLGCGFQIGIFAILVIGVLWFVAWRAMASHAKQDLAANGTQITGTVETREYVHGKNVPSAWWGEVSYVAPGQTAPQTADLWLVDADNTPEPAIGSSVTLVYEKGNSQSPDTLADLQQNLGNESFVSNILAIFFFGAIGLLVYMAIMARMNRPVDTYDDEPRNSPPQTMPPLTGPSEREDYWNSVDKKQ